MIIEISITAKETEYGQPLAKTGLTLDSEDIDADTVASLASDATVAAIRRANKKLAERSKIAPPVATEPEEMPIKAF